MKSEKQVLENTIESYLVKRVSEIGGIAFKWESPGNAGVPDRMVVLPGAKVCFIETKRPKNGRTAALQRYQLKRLRRLGHDARIASNKEEVDQFIEEVAQCSSSHTTTKSTPSTG